MNEAPGFGSIKKCPDVTEKDGFEKSSREVHYQIECHTAVMVTAEALHDGLETSDPPTTRSQSNED